MGVRPPQNDDDEEPEAVSFGIAALDAYLDDADVSYPVRSEELVERLGDPEIPYDASGNGVELSAALDRAHFDQFETEQELLNTLHPVFESYRERGPNDLVGRLRRLLPF
ncbi:hypothetical protein [Halorarius halobius]|uniref:DUF5789 family protein n=1 Tax=Halorarius halobius TaxID=2962671 RepID=UPI0020CC3CE6|nr:hypothetical protein [Halorarius halobius]